MASPKYRDYFITINKGADCYDNALEIVKDLNVKLYALIVHDKDKDIDEEGNITEKQVHKHVVLELVNPITFNSMKNHFNGAHVETIKYKKAAYQYLLHNSPHSHEKYQYAFEEIISNNSASVKAAIEAEEGLRIFNEREFLRYIAEGLNTPYQFTKAFGLNVYKQYWKAYEDMLENLKTDPIMRRDLEDIKKQMEEELENSLPF